MDIEEMESLRKSLCSANNARIKKLENQLWWFTALAFSNLVVMVIALLKGVVLK